MKITFSRKKWSAIFTEIDKNYDDEIAFEELFIFLFPNHDRALAVVLTHSRTHALTHALAHAATHTSLTYSFMQERKRLQNLKKSVRERLLLQRKQQQSESSVSSRNFHALSFRSQSSNGTH